MLTDSQREYLKAAARTMQIIVASLAAGVASFLTVVLLMLPQGQPAGAVPAEQLIVSYSAATFGFAAILAWALVPGMIAGRMRQAIADGKPTAAPGLVGNLPPNDDRLQISPLVAMYQTPLIIGSAILEGAAFFNVIAYMHERQQMNLVIVGVLLFLLLSQIPTVSRLESWMEHEQASIDQLRLMRRA